MVSYIGEFISSLKKALKQSSENLIKDPLLRKRIRVQIQNAQMMKHFRLDWLANQTKEIDIFDYETNIKPKFHKYTELYRGNTLYGNERVMNVYSGHRKPIKGCIEHGLYFGETTFDTEIKDTGLPALLTYSEVRKNHIRKKSDICTIAVGPYIHYANAIEEIKINAIRKSLGKTLLVFPMHSTDVIKCEYDIEEYIKYIRKFSEDKKFQSVIICMFYRDIELGRDKKYIDAGYKIVSAGYKVDPFFLERLKSIFLISDYVLTNDVGTHVGYAVYLNKPVFIWKQNRKYSGRGKNDVLENVPTEKFESANNEKNEIYEAFSNYSENISNCQFELCKKYWGFDCVRSKKEMKKILDDLDDIFELSIRKKISFAEAIKSLKEVRSDTIQWR